MWLRGVSIIGESQLVVIQERINFILSFNNGRGIYDERGVIMEQ